MKFLKIKGDKLILVLLFLFVASLSNVNNKIHHSISAHSSSVSHLAHKLESHLTHGSHEKNHNVPQPPPMKNSVKSNIPKPPQKKSSVPAAPSLPDHINKNKENSKNDFPTLEEINKHQGYNNNVHATNKKNDLPTLDEINKHNEEKSSKSNIGEGIVEALHHLPKSESHHQSNAKHATHGNTTSNILPSLVGNNDTNHLPNNNGLRTDSTQKPKKEKGFFQKTSDSNQSIAWKALTGFVFGFILFFVSIQLICFNERRAVKYTEFIDWVNNEKNIVEIERGNPAESIDSRKGYIVKGALDVTRESTVPGLNLNIKSDQGKILFIKVLFEKYEVTHSNDNENNDGDNQGDQTVEGWIPNFEGKAKLSTSVEYGEAYVDGIYKFDLSKIEYLVNSLEEMENVYQFSPHEIPELDNFIRGRTYGEFRTFVDGNYVYILKDNLINYAIGNGFDPNTYRPGPNDRRLKIQYYSVKHETFITLGGKLNPLKDGKIEVVPLISEYKKAAWNLYLCCCGESDERYQFDICYLGLWNSQQIVASLNEENQCITWVLRILGFVLHFAAYYLILYPLILLIGYIPILGAVGAVVLILFAFLLSLATFLLIIALAWVFARPIMAILLFALIIGLIFISKLSKEHLKAQDTNNNGNDNNRFLVKFF